jgi:hypothetical protein
MKDNTVGDTFCAKRDSSCLKCCRYVWGVQRLRHLQISVVHEIDHRSEIAKVSMVLSLQCEHPKEGQIEQLEDLRSLGGESNDPHSGRVKTIPHINL